MKITQLAGIGVVVADLDAATRDYARLADVTDWTLGEVTDGVQQVCHGRRTSGGTYRWASALTPFDPDGEVLGQPQRAIRFELIQPTGGETPFHEFLLGTGEGICFLSVVAPDADAAAVAEHFAGLGIRAAYRERSDAGERVLWDTRAALGGYLLEVVPALPEPDGEPLHLDGAELREGRPALPMQGILHFGVVVDDLMASLEQYYRVLGIQKWAVKTWQTEPGRLDAPYYRDLNPVQHGYFTAQGFCDDFGFEVIQMKYGPSHYNREFTDERGPGIHHVFPFLTTKLDEWVAVSDSMSELGAPLVMGSDLRGGASEYGYYDTFGALRGFLVEGVHRRYPADPQYMAPDFEVDFAALENDGEVA